MNHREDRAIPEIILPRNFPTIITLVGSSRFMEEHTKVMKEETLLGHIAIGMGMFGHNEGLDMNGPVKKMLDELHRRKIDLADKIIVVCPICRTCPSCKSVWPHTYLRVEKCSCGTEVSDVAPAPYIGESTAKEIKYAQEMGKEIIYRS